MMDVGTLDDWFYDSHEEEAVQQQPFTSNPNPYFPMHLIVKNPGTDNGIPQLGVDLHSEQLRPGCHRLEVPTDDPPQLPPSVSDASHAEKAQREPAKPKKQSGAGRKRARPAAKEPSVSEESAPKQDENRLTEMSQRFKKRRAELEYSQKDVADSICGCFSTDMSQTTISRFETCKLSARNMDTIRQLLDDWMEKLDDAIKDGKTADQFLRETKAKAVR